MSKKMQNNIEISEIFEAKSYAKNYNNFSKKSFPISNEFKINTSSIKDKKIVKIIEFIEKGFKSKIFFTIFIIVFWIFSSTIFSLYESGIIASAKKDYLTNIIWFTTIEFFVLLILLRIFILVFKILYDKKIRQLEIGNKIYMYLNNVLILLIEYGNKSVLNNYYFLKGRDRSLFGRGWKDKDIFPVEIKFLKIKIRSRYITILKMLDYVIDNKISLENDEKIKCVPDWLPNDSLDVIRKTLLNEKSKK